MSAPASVPPGVRGCAVCGKPVVPAYRPFCSRRCADVDLARWLRGDYAVPGKDGEAAMDPEERG